MLVHYRCVYLPHCGSTNLPTALAPENAFLCFRQNHVLYAPYPVQLLRPIKFSVFNLIHTIQYFFQFCEKFYTTCFSYSYIRFQVVFLTLNVTRVFVVKVQIIFRFSPYGNSPHRVVSNPLSSPFCSFMLILTLSVHKCLIFSNSISPLCFHTINLYELIILFVQHVFLIRSFILYSALSL